MKKIRSLFVLLFLAAPLRADTPPLDRYGGHYDVQINTAPYDMHYRFYAEPSVNDFEYRSMLDDVYAIWNGDFPSDCAKLKVINILLERRIDPYLTYPPDVSRSTITWNDMDIAFLSTTTAVNMGLISTNTIGVDFTVAYSTIEWCQDGSPLPSWFH